ncbi:hypothetical protein [Methylobacterium nigriterrae]|uniref:hypothetical protein n=1 Tax=Methylobacterium nigriterrae TaxID=3127512 RepID=UPI0030135757
MALARRQHRRDGLAAAFSAQVQLGREAALAAYRPGEIRLSFGGAPLLPAAVSRVLSFS